MKVLAAAVRAVAAGRKVALVTVVGVNGSAPRASGARMLVETDGSIYGTVGGGAWEHRLVDEALAALHAGRNRRVQLNLSLDLGMCCGGVMEALIEPLAPNPQLVIYGAGHVGTALAWQAERLGFDLTLVDERDEWLEASRFPPSARCLLTDPRRALADLPCDRNSYHLVVTHSHQLDQDLVERLLPLELAWLGMIGSRAKVARFLVRLEAAGLDPLLFPRLSSPVGLDLGAETPEEIAVSIAAELIAVRRRTPRPPLPLSQLPLRARGGDGRAHPPGPRTPADEP